MNNLDLYNKVRKVPTEAQKPIQGGRLKGMTDINPMWRIKALTEEFGPVGLGWYYRVLEKRIEEGANSEKVAFVDIELFVKYEDEWSMPIQGTGGSSFISKERNGLYTSDECFKMALTDALGVAMKSLGVAADVYFEKDRTKHDTPTEVPQSNKESKVKNGNDKCSSCDESISEKVNSFSSKKYGKPLCFECQKQADDKDDDKKAIKEGSLISKDQAEQIVNLMKLKKYTGDSILSYIKTAYSKDDYKNLTVKEANEVIEMLKGL